MSLAAVSGASDLGTTRALAALGQAEDARALQQRALAIREAQHGPEYVEVAGDATADDLAEARRTIAALRSFAGAGS